MYNLSGSDLDNQDQNLTPTHPKIVKTLLVITNNELGATLVIILLILILIKIIREYLSTRPTKEERLKELRERARHWQKKLEYAYTVFIAITEEEQRFVQRHKGFVLRDISLLKADDLETLFQQISIALNKYPEHIRKDALAQGESKGNLDTVKHKKEKVGRRPVTRSSTQKAVPLGDRWK